MTRRAVLLMDLQQDFLSAEGGRLPVLPEGAAAVISTANALLSRQVLPQALLNLILNQFPAEDRIANFFRKGAAIAGTAGASLDPRIVNHGPAKVLTKASASTFSNPELNRLLRAEQVTDLYIMGVFAEGCVRATVVDAIRLGYSVHVMANAIASNAAWKKTFALWAMKRAGANIMQSVHAQTAS